MTDDCLLVTFILPIRNEARYIKNCLAAVLAQQDPRAAIEVWVVDGMSDDGTREIVREFAARESRVRLLDNPTRIVPTALNQGIRAARGEIIIRVDGHAVIAPDYMSRCLDALAQVDADCVGGPIQTMGETWTARAIALAQSSPFGVGSAAFRYATRAQFVDTLAFGAYRRAIFDRVGLFDQELVRNQDDEFNFRLTRAGGKIWLDPRIQAVYYSRGSLRALWQQYFEYGFWKVRVIQKHSRPASLRHLVPGAFVGALCVSCLLGIFFSPLWLGAVTIPYLLAALGVTLKLSAQKGWQYAPLLPLVFAAMHLAYGLGFIGGLAWFGWRGWRPSTVR